MTISLPSSLVYAQDQVSSFNLNRSSFTNQAQAVTPMTAETASSSTVKGDVRHLTNDYMWYLLHKSFEDLGVKQEIVTYNGEQYLTDSAFNQHLKDSNGNYLRAESTGLTPDGNATTKAYAKIIFTDAPKAYANDTSVFVISTNQNDQAPTFHGTEVDKLTKNQGLKLFGATQSQDGTYSITDTEALGHFDNMHQLLRPSYYGVGALTELDLAVLQDIGENINRKSYIGQTFDDNTVLNSMASTNNFGSFTSPNANSISTGIHVLKHNFTLREQGSLYQTGQMAVGVRISGVNDTFILDKNALITGNGECGYGIVVDYGHGHNINIDGTLIASGGQGVGIYVRGSGLSPYFTPNYTNDFIATHPLNWALMKQTSADHQGSTVKNINLTGIISGKYAAIDVAPGELLENINLSGTAAILGDIKPGERPNLARQERIKNAKGKLYTDLNFGVKARTHELGADSLANLSNTVASSVNEATKLKTATNQAGELVNAMGVSLGPGLEVDHNFKGYFEGNINRDFNDPNRYYDTNINFNVFGGELTYSGHANVYNALVAADATMILNDNSGIYVVPPAILTNYQTGSFKNLGTIYLGNNQVAQVEIEGSLDSRDGTLVFNFNEDHVSNLILRVDDLYGYSGKFALGRLLFKPTKSFSLSAKSKALTNGGLKWNFSDIITLGNGITSASGVIDVSNLELVTVPGLDISYTLNPDTLDGTVILSRPTNGFARNFSGNTKTYASILDRAVRNPELYGLKTQELLTNLIFEEDLNVLKIMADSLVPTNYLMLNKANLEKHLGTVYQLRDLELADGAFGKVFGNYREQDARSNYNSFHMSDTEFVLGVNKNWGGFTLKPYFGYSQMRFKDHGDASSFKASGIGLFAGLGAKINLAGKNGLWFTDADHSLYLDGHLLGAFDRFNTERNAGLKGTIYERNYHAKYYTFSGVGSLNLNFAYRNDADYIITPSIGFDLAYSMNEEFSEKGDHLNLWLKSNDFTYSHANVGLKASKTFKPKAKDDLTIKAEVGGTFYHEFGTENEVDFRTLKLSHNMSFDDFSDRNYFEVKGKVSATNQSDLEFNTSVRSTVGRSGYTDAGVDFEVVLPF